MYEQRPPPNYRLKQQRQLRGWSQAKLAEEIGTTPVSISRWETGITSPDPFYREKLCTLFEKNAFELGFITEDPGRASGRSQQIGPDAIDLDSKNGQLQEEARRLWPPTIPNEFYYSLPGREQALDRLLAALQQAQGVPAVVVDGLGGLGKTALAAELARRAVRQGYFQGVIGASAKLEDFGNGEIVPVRDTVLDFEQVLDSLARQLGRWELPPLKREEKQTILARLLHQQPYLVFLDNLETADNTNALLAQLRPLLGVSRGIITSRTQARHDYVQHLSLRGLELADSLIFLKADMHQRGMQQVLDQKRLVEIHEVTGGAPLAMKLVVAQTNFLNVNLVLSQMRTAGSERLYTYIYRRSWLYLSPVAQRVLYYIGKTTVTAVDWEELRNVGIAETEAELLRGIQQLLDYSLLEAASRADEQWYGIHQLTRQFVNGELPKLWQEQGLL